MIVIISDRAVADLENVGRFIAQDDPGRSASFVNELLAACNGLLPFPRVYPADPRFGTHARRRTYGNYHIIYDVFDDRIMILAIAHVARDPDAFP